MKQIHRQEKKQFENLFRQEQIDRLEDRFKVLETFLQTEAHVTDKELFSMLKEKGYGLSPDFVRETLKLMCRFGFARANRFDKGLTRYEHLHIGEHHDHIVCIKCRKIIEFENNQLEKLQEQIAGGHDFYMLWHKMEIYGICSECLKDRVQGISLVTAKQGERLIIKDFTGGTSARVHLLSMGLRIGDEIEIITNPNKGQVVIARDFNRIALGRGIAQKILVQPVRGSENSEVRI